MHKPEYHVFLCASVRLNGTQKGFCHSKGAVRLAERLVELIDGNGLQDKVMVTHTGCFGICQKGPVMMVYPENVWYGALEEEDLEALVESHFVNGIPFGEKRIDG